MSVASSIMRLFISGSVRRVRSDAITAACGCTTSGGLGIMPLTIASERGAKPATATMTKNHAMPAWK
ncbi:MAG TPA: hypothetical protein VNY82_00125 [Steroidobacteraceae bacterium]|nr:hypothetical protein [Steroidobacteraceae bacterium]